MADLTPEERSLAPEVVAQNRHWCPKWKPDPPVVISHGGIGNEKTTVRNASRIDAKWGIDEIVVQGTARKKAPFLLHLEQMSARHYWVNLAGRTFDVYLNADGTCTVEEQ
jgi:hypothetical protein